MNLKISTKKISVLSSFRYNDKYPEIQLKIDDFSLTYFRFLRSKINKKTPHLKGAENFIFPIPHCEKYKDMRKKSESKIKEKLEFPLWHSEKESN